jgi:hypothetical protein
MAVQIYQNEELNDIMFQVEALDEWKEIANNLGMDSQLDFVKRAESPIPYPNINKSMELIFSTLCPTKIDFKKYNKTPIPLEVLKQISYSVKENHFTKIEVWYDDKAPDPFAIGYIEKYNAVDDKWKELLDADGNKMEFGTNEQAKNYCDIVGFSFYTTRNISSESYLIARWADEIRPIPELKELAKERLMEKFGAELRIEVEEKTQALKKLSDNLIRYLSAEISEGQLKGSRW